MSRNRLLNRPGRVTPYYGRKSSPSVGNPPVYGAGCVSLRPLMMSQRPKRQTGMGPQARDLVKKTEISGGDYGLERFLGSNIVSSAVTGMRD